MLGASPQRSWCQAVLQCFESRGSSRARLCCACPAWRGVLPPLRDPRHKTHVPQSAFSDVFIWQPRRFAPKGRAGSSIRSSRLLPGGECAAVAVGGWLAGGWRAVLIGIRPRYDRAGMCAAETKPLSARCPCFRHAKSTSRPPVWEGASARCRIGRPAVQPDSATLAACRHWIASAHSSFALPRSRAREIRFEQGVCCRAPRNPPGFRQRDGPRRSSKVAIVQTLQLPSSGRLITLVSS